MNGPLPKWLSPMSIPASWLYGAAMQRRNARFDRGIGVQSIDRPVISVGNITTGGTGKTPFVIWLAQRLLADGIRPAIAMRGYGGGPGRKSDEEMEYADRLPAVPVVADPDRVNALRQFLLEREAIDCIVLDDGFQHRFLKRELDLVLVDASDDLMRQRLLPAGHLRELPTNLRRADAVIVTRASGIDCEMARAIEQWHGRPPVAWTRHSWKHLCLVGNQAQVENAPVDWLGGKRIVTLLGVGNPAAVRRQVEQAGAEIAADIPARDHERYSRAKVDRAIALTGQADALLVTWKDWARLRAMDLPRRPVPIVVPEVEIEVIAGLEALDSLLDRCVSESQAATAGKFAR